MTTLPTVLPLIGLDGIVLTAGSHSDRAAGVCAMEAAAWIAGEPHSDHPACVCPVIGAFLRSWNDAIRDDAHRNALLKPLLPHVVASAATPAIARQRSYLAFDWLARVQVPAWLDLTPALAPHAATLRALTPLSNKASVAAAVKPLAAARAAAWDAAAAAAGAAAAAAAWAALQPTATRLEASALDLIDRMLALRGGK